VKIGGKNSIIIKKIFHTHFDGTVLIPILPHQKLEFSLKRGSFLERLRFLMIKFEQSTILPIFKINCDRFQPE